MGKTSVQFQKQIFNARKDKNEKKRECGKKRMKNLNSEKQSRKNRTKSKYINKNWHFCCA